MKSDPSQKNEWQRKSHRFLKPKVNYHPKPDEPSPHTPTQINYTEVLKYYSTFKVFMFSVSWQCCKLIHLKKQVWQPLLRLTLTNYRVPHTVSFMWNVIAFSKLSANNVKPLKSLWNADTFAIIPIKATVHKCIGYCHQKSQKQLLNNIHISVFLTSNQRIS